MCAFWANLGPGRKYHRMAQSRGSMVGGSMANFERLSELLGEWCMGVAAPSNVGQNQWDGIGMFTGGTGF